MLELSDPHPIVIEPLDRHVRITFDGSVIAETDSALTLFEADLPPAIYIPRADVDLARTVRAEMTTVCPYKGIASYFDLVGSTRTARGAAWSYENPKPRALAIREMLSFYPGRVEIEIQ